MKKKKPKKRKPKRPAPKARVALDTAKTFENQPLR